MTGLPEGGGERCEIRRGGRREQRGEGAGGGKNEVSQEELKIGLVLTLSPLINTPTYNKKSSHTREGEQWRSWWGREGKHTCVTAPQTQVYQPVLRLTWSET